MDNVEIEVSFLDAFTIGMKRVSDALANLAKVADKYNRSLSQLNRALERMTFYSNVKFKLTPKDARNGRKQTVHQRVWELAYKRGGNG